MPIWEGSAVDAGCFWECGFSPALPVFWLCCSCGHCQSAESYRMNFGEGLNLPNLCFCCSLLVRGYLLRTSCVCLWEVIGLGLSHSFTVLALLCVCCQGLALNDFLFFRFEKNKMIVLSHCTKAVFS